MSKKKVRGIKRKTNDMISRIKEQTYEFPTEFYNDYWHMHLPVAQEFIDNQHTPKRVKKLCIQTLINRAHHLTALIPTDKEKYRVVAAVDFPDLWNSQIIVFKSDSYFSSFFDRNDEYQKWIPLSESRNIQEEWQLTIPKNFSVAGYKEIITDEDEPPHEGEIWFIGNLI